jgi:hypothetical protein
MNFRWHQGQSKLDDALDPWGALIRFIFKAKPHAYSIKLDVKCYCRHFGCMSFNESGRKKNPASKQSFKSSSTNNEEHIQSSLIPSIV